MKYFSKKILQKIYSLNEYEIYMHSLQVINFFNNQVLNYEGIYNKTITKIGKEESKDGSIFGNCKTQ